MNTIMNRKKLSGLIGQLQFKTKKDNNGKMKKQRERDKNLEKRELLKRLRKKNKLKKEKKK